MYSRTLGFTIDTDFGIYNSWVSLYIACSFCYRCQKDAQQTFSALLRQKVNRLQFELLVQQIAYLEARQKRLVREIDIYLDAIPNQLITISGTGRIFAAVFLGEISDIRRFRNAKALAAYTGMDPSVNQSSEFTAEKAHLSKRGSTHLRRAIWLTAAAVVRHDEAP